MKDTNFEQAAGTQDGGQPKPWDRQPGEPEDCYYWFRLYLTQPIPRKVAQVARLIGTNSERTYLSKIARQWRWEERAICFDADKAQQIVIQAEMREQLLLDQLFDAQFQACSTQPRPSRTPSSTGWTATKRAATSPRLRSTSAACSVSFCNRVSRPRRAPRKSATKTLSRSWSRKGLWLWLRSGSERVKSG